MKLKQFIPVRETLERLAHTKGMPAAVTLRLARYWRTLGPELATYERERVRLVHELGFNDGQTITVLRENEATFNEQIEAMQAEEIELNIKPFDMIDFQNAGLSVVEILALEDAGLLTVDWQNIEEEAA